MSHDPLCPVLRVFKGECDSCDACDLIAKVRADERRQAAQRISVLPHWTDGWPERVLAAVRGEES